MTSSNYDRYLTGFELYLEGLHSMTVVVSNIALVVVPVLVEHNDNMGELKLHRHCHGGYIPRSE
jgi:hypothetical protein